MTKDLTKNFKSLEEQRNESNEKRIEEFLEIFMRYLDDIEERLGIFYAKYGSSDSVDTLEAEMNLTGNDLNIVKRKLTEYLDKAAELGITFDKDLENDLSSIKNISRLDGFILETKSLISLMIGEIEIKMREELEEQYTDSATQTAYYLYRYLSLDGDFSDDDWNKVMEALFLAWRADGATWDEMLWRYKRWLMSDTGKEITFAVKQQKSFSDILAILIALFERTRRNVGGVMKSDSAHVGNRGVFDMALFLGIEEFIYTAIVDDRTSDICLALNGAVMTEADEEYFPPNHNYCRSFLVPAYESDKIDEYLDIRYSEWYEERFG